MSDSALPAIADLLRQKIGLDPNSVGPKATNSAVMRRMRELEVASSGEYLTLVQSSAKELELLIEEVVVTETWFFRDREPFVFLDRFIRETWLPSNPRGSLRAWSIPCSTGEEPYSIAINLRQAGLPAQRFCIDAVDISAKAINQARLGKYGKHSFRGQETRLPRPFIRQLGSGERYEVDESIRRRVNFLQANLLEIPPGEVTYDIVFCRNLLIYLDSSARERVARAIARVLKPDGLLFVGQSEKMELLSHGYIPVDALFSCLKLETTLFNKPGGKRHGVPRSGKHGSMPLPPANGKSEKEGTVSRKGKQETKERVSRPTQHGAPASVLAETMQNASVVQGQPTRASQALTAFDRASELADRGVMQEAQELCEAYLRENQVDVNAYVLLGQIRQSLGDSAEAERCFHKAIFLEPEHYEALTHLCLLKEGQGDEQGARFIRKRLTRAGKG